MQTFSQQKDITSLFATFFIATSLFLTGCASNELVETEAESVEIEADDATAAEIDPYEGFNRKIFLFNEVLDDYVAEPVSDAYLWVTPQFVQTGVANFFNNLKDINVVLNDVMQGKVKQGAEDTGRFAVNSTVGLLGLFDVATDLGLEKHEEDFAQTLAVWGVPQGPYLVLPVIGPATTRGVPGGIFDTAANPATYVGYPVQLLQMLNARANAEGALSFIDEAALDRYVFTRESFLQYRKHLITDGKSEITDDTLDFEDDFYDDDEENAGIEGTDTEVNNSETSEHSQDANISLKDEPGKMTGHTLKLSSDVEGFGKASNSFDGAVKSFNEASESFEQANEKINRLK